jgi:hypothetical protein
MVNPFEDKSTKNGTRGAVSSEDFVGVPGMTMFKPSLWVEWPEFTLSPFALFFLSSHSRKT